MKITEPTLILDELKCKQNIQRMKSKADACHLAFWPHFKTHQSKIVGQWFRDVGVQHITVSSLGMAEYFAADGWKEIIVAFPTNILQEEKIISLAQRIELTLLVDHLEIVEKLNALGVSINLMVEIDIGNGRTGVLHSDVDAIHTLKAAIDNSDNLTFSGLYTHAGHSYSCKGTEEIEALHTIIHERLQELKHSFSENFFICMGDTPTCSIGKSFPGCDAISAGNLVFYDAMQAQIGSCDFSDIAVAVACPVVSKNEARKEICIYGGAVHLSKDFLEVNNQRAFGFLAATHAAHTWGKMIDGCYLKSISQEHGILAVTEEIYETINVGDVVMILPVHSCLTAQALGGYVTTSGQKIDHF